MPFPQRTAVAPRTSRPGARHSAPRRAALVVPVLAGAVLALGACSATNPMTTKNDYQASDGVAADIGDLHLGNLIVLTAEEGGAGTVIGYARNRGPEQVTATIEVDGDGGTVRLGGGETASIGPERDSEVEVGSVPAPPGALVEVTITSDAGEVTVQAPVLDGTLPEYAELVPEP